MNQVPTHSMASALGAMAAMARQHLGFKQEQAAAELKAGALAHMLDALVTHRVDIIKEGFTKILSTYDDQARHCMAQQGQYVDKELEATDPFTRLQWRARIEKLDSELATIRADARLLYDRMADVLIALGDNTPKFAETVSPNLHLSTMR